MLGQIEQFVAVASLVDNVSYLPLAVGRRTPDSAQITTIGPEVSSIEIMFLDALTPASIAAFSIANNLVFSGVSADPTRPPSFNTEPIGRIRAGQVLTIPLASPLPEGGPFSVALVSDPQRNELRTIGGESRFVGSFDFSFRVVARDGVRPMVSRIVTSNAEVSSFSALQTLAGGPVFDLVEPHSPIHLEFSEPMTSGIPVLTSPSFPVETTATVDGVTFRFFIARTPGLSFQEVRSPIIPGTLALASTEDSALMLETTYVIDIPSDTSLGLQTTAATDLSGEPLAAFVDGLARAPLMDFRLTLRSSGVSISVPSPRALVTRANLDEGTVRVAGTAAMHVDGIVVELLSPEGQALTSVPATMTGTTRPIPLFEVRTWEASLPASAFAEIEDTLRIRARSVAAGGDSIPVRVDTVGPEIRAVTGTLDLFANAADLIQRICVEVAPPGPGVDPADRADLTFGGIVLASNEAPEFFFDDGAQFGTSPKFGFCFRDVDVTGLLGVGRHTLRVNAFDVLGNVSIADVEIRVHPWLSSVTPDLVQIAPSTPREILIRGVELNGFNGDAGDVVRVDGRDLPGPVSIVKIFSDLSPDLPPRFALRTTLPDTASPGPITVLIEGMESNRLRFEVCRPDASKFVREVPFGPFPHLGPDHALERGPLGEPVVFQTDIGQVRKIRWNGTSYEELPGHSDSALRPGDPIEVVRLPDGDILPIWISGDMADPSSPKSLRTPGLAFALPPGLLPRTLKVAYDAQAGAPIALIVSRFVEPAPLALIGPPGSGGEAPPVLMVVRLYTLLPSGITERQMGEFAVSGNAAYSGGIAMASDGTGWVLASSNETKLWRRAANGNWIRSGELNGVTIDAAASVDGSRFHAVLRAANAIHYVSVGVSGTWSVEWSSEASAVALDAFRPPGSAVAHPRSQALLNAGAAIRIAPDGSPRIAFMDFTHRTLRYLRALPSGAQPATIDVLDLDVTLGHFVSLALDGNGEGLVTYVDFSHADAFADPDLTDELHPRTSAQILFVDTRNRNPVVAGNDIGSSACAPDRFHTASISRENWDTIRADQKTRTLFTFNRLFTAFLGGFPPPPMEPQERRLQAVQGSAAVTSRLLSLGSIKVTGETSSPGEPIPGTIHSVGVQDFEQLGIRTPVGARSVSTVRIRTPDAEISRLYVASFQPERNLACDANPNDDVEPEIPPARRDAAMAYDPTGPRVVLFGGRTEDDVFLRDTWVLEATLPGEPECWTRVSTSGPFPRSGHVMATAPGGRGVVLFGGRRSNANQEAVVLDDTWLFSASSGWQILSPAGAPSARGDAAMAFDSTANRVWLFGGRVGALRHDDLWTLELSGAGPATTAAWSHVSDGPPAPRASAGLAFDASRGKLLLFGGADGTLPLIPTTLENDVWELDAATATWRTLVAGSRDNPITPDGGFRGRARAGAAVAVPAGWDTLVAFGGLTHDFGFRPPLLDISSNSTDALDLAPYYDADPLNGDPLTPSWSRLHRAAEPIAREGQAWAYDPDQNRLVVFGGRHLSTLLDDTVQLRFGANLDESEWEMTVPGKAIANDVLLIGEVNDVTPVQWSRSDAYPLFSQPEIFGFAGAFGGVEELPIVRDLGRGATFYGTDYELGDIKFSRVLSPEPSTASAATEATQGLFTSALSLGHFTLRGILAIEDLTYLGTNFGDVRVDVRITTDIPTLKVDVFDVGTGKFVEHDTGIPTPERCSLFLNASTEAYQRLFPMEGSLALAPAVDHRGPTQGDLDDDPYLAQQSHSWIVGETMQGGIRTDVPLCFSLEGPVPLPLANAILATMLYGGNPPAAVAVLMTLTEASRLAGLVPLPGGGVPAGDGPVGVLDPFLGAVVVDAFTNPIYAGMRTGRLRAIDSPKSALVRGRHDDPEWIYFHESGVTLSFRTSPVFLVPGSPPVVALP